MRTPRNLRQLELEDLRRALERPDEDCQSDADRDRAPQLPPRRWRPRKGCVAPEGVTEGPAGCTESAFIARRAG